MSKSTYNIYLKKLQLLNPSEEQLLYQEKISGILKLIGESDFIKAVDLLDFLLNNISTDIDGELLVIRSTYIDNDKNKKKGTIDEQEWNRKRTQLKYQLLDLINESIPRTIKVQDIVKQFSDTYRRIAIPDSQNLAKLIGSSDHFLTIHWIEKAAEVAKSVCRIVVKRGNNSHNGTGFLTKNGYLFTNHHVLTSPQDAENATVQFNFLNYNSTIYEYRLDAKDFITSPVNELDYTRVKVIDKTIQDKSLKDWGFLTLAPSTELYQNTPLIIIQHPKGAVKKITYKNNAIKQLDKTTVHYSNNTEAESNGSPVFTKDWKVVALHHHYTHKQAANEGVLFKCILNDIAQRQEKNYSHTNTPKPNSKGEGKIAHDIPDIMLLNKYHICTIRVAYADLTDAILVQGLTKYRIEIIRKMADKKSKGKVNLIDFNDAFEVKQINPSEEQEIFLDDYTEWVYQITPTKTGQQPLTLAFTAISDNGTKDMLFQKTVTIAVNETTTNETNKQEAQAKSVNRTDKPNEIEEKENTGDLTIDKEKNNENVFDNNARPVKSSGGWFNTIFNPLIENTKDLFDDIKESITEITRGLENDDAPLPSMTFQQKVFTPPISVFFFYTESDKMAANELRKGLFVLERIEKTIEVIDIHKNGTDFHNDLKKAHVVLLFISEELFATSYQLCVETLQHQQDTGGIVIPILTKSFLNWNLSEITKLPALPSNNLFIDKFDRAHTAYKMINKELITLIKKCLSNN